MRAPLGAAAQDAAGTVDSVATISTVELLHFSEEHYTARNMTVAVVSPMAHTEVVALVGAAFAALPSRLPTPTWVR